MKILLVTPVYWPELFRINDLTLALVAAGHEIEVLAGMPNYPEGRIYTGYSWRGPFDERWGGARILRFPVFPRGKGRAWELVLHYVSWLLGACGRLLGNSAADWDVIFVFQTTPVTAALPALLARRFSGAPAVIWVQDLWPEIVRASGLVTHPVLIRAIGWLSNAIYGAFDKVVTQSVGFMEALALRGVPHERLSCIHNWAEALYGVAETSPGSSAVSPWPGDFVVMFAGNLGRVQGLPTVLEAAERLKAHPHINWVLIGDGALADWLKDEIVNRGLQQTVWLLGRHPVERMPEFFAMADTLLLSLGRSEALALTVPGKLQSYMASGKPIIGSADGEAARVIEASGAGWVAPAEHPEELADLVLKMAGLTVAERIAMGQAGREYYELNFDRNECIKNIEMTLRDMGLSR